MFRYLALFIPLSISLSPGVFGQNHKSKGIVKAPVILQKSHKPDTASHVIKPGIPAGNEKHFQEVQSRLTKLLAEKKFSLFATQMRNALHQFPGNKKLLELKKQFVIQDYQSSVLHQVRLPDEKYFEKKPSPSSCQPGIVNALGHQYVLGRINYVRRLAGLYDSCVFDPALNRRCQMASLMIDANGKLDHAPKSNWKCYTKEGASVSANSNLSMGYNFADAVMGQMEDDGSGNAACGHRRWILNPYNNVFGHGSTFNAMTLSVFGAGDPKLVKKTGFVDTQFICWPSADFFPIDLVPERWSFSLANADFSQAKVTVMLNGKPLKVKIEPMKVGYAVNTLVWTVAEVIQANQAYSVSISRVKVISGWGRNASGNMRTYSYQVIPLQIK